MTEYTSEQPAGRHLGRYIVRRRIGAGGFARVYLGWDPDLEIEVAIKIPKPQLAEDEGALERFRREATTAARLRHPNVVTVLTVGRIDERFDGVPTDTPYLVMDYLPESLASRLTATPTLPEAEWLQIGAEVGRGLAYAHSRSVIHRDIKPDNILFGRHGEAVLTDFGIARAVVEGMTAASRSIVVGTPEYFSPEQARGLPFDQRTDIYGLGVTLFRAATGALPFTGVDWYAIMRQHVEDAPPAPRSLNPALSVEAERLILRCLAKAPDDRYQRVDDLLIDIETARQRLGRGGGYGPVGETVELGRAYVARRRSSRVWNAVAVPLLVGSGTGLWFLARSAYLGTAVRPADARPVEPVAPPVVESAPPPASVPVTVPHESTPAPVIAQRASLAVNATSGALLFLNGQYVSVSSWRVDSLPPGQYQVRAQLATLNDCATAAAASSVDLRAGDRQSITLRPLPCGSVALSDIRPNVAYYALSGPVQLKGSLPLPQPLVLPIGDYRLTITKAYCAAFDDTLRVTAGTTLRPHVTLFCQ